MDARLPEHVGSPRGWTLLEVTAVLTIVVALIAIVVPLAVGESQEARVAKAVAQTHALARSLGLYERDTGFDPTGTAGAATAHVLLGPGTVPTLGAMGSGPALSLEDFLCNATHGGAGWSGPYLEAVPLDPWDRAYLVNAHGFFSEERVWVLSAGADGVVQTDPSSLVAGGDDVGVVAK